MQASGLLPETTNVASVSVSVNHLAGANLAGAIWFDTTCPSGDVHDTECAAL